MLGHVCLLAALASSTVAGLSRIPSTRANARPLIEYPFTLAVALMVALFAESTTSRNPSHEMFLIPHDGWITAY
ncbi:MAG: hypothetical protein JOY55_16635 [Mycobacterium sp.]|nr:hypothetical protein [Mycobacterium sp.]MBV8293407.1 hypothetical protein [Mycobacterium sp.]